MNLFPIRRLAMMLFLFLGLRGFSQINMAAPIPVDPNVKVGRLPNGLTYYIRRNTQPEKKVELRLAVNAGGTHGVINDAVE